jgi:hypothetical protein
MTSEAELQAHVVELAEQWFGWRWVHFRPAKTKHGWRTPVSGPLGKGWPDLILARPGRIVAAELKGDGGKVEPEQQDVLAALAAAGVETYVWWPKDWNEIVEVLR